MATAKYKIKRGQFLRREGVVNQFKTYTKGDDVEMSDAEANAFGRGRLISGGGVHMPTAADVAKVEASHTPPAAAPTGTTKRK